MHRAAMMMMGIVAALGLLVLGRSEAAAQAVPRASHEVQLAQAAGAPGGQATEAQPPGTGGGATGHGGGTMAPGGGMMGRAMGPGMMGGHGGPMMGGMMRGPTPGMGHLEHLMVHDPKAAARVMRFRADLLRAISEVLAKHAAELERTP
jgi:hypothetical protein